MRCRRLALRGRRRRWSVGHGWGYTDRSGCPEVRCGTGWRAHGAEQPGRSPWRADGHCRFLRPPPGDNAAVESFSARLQMNVLKEAVADTAGSTTRSRDLDRTDLPPQAPPTRARQAHADRVRVDQTSRSRGVANYTPNESAEPTVVPNSFVSPPTRSVYAPRTPIRTGAAPHGWSCRRSFSLVRDTSMS